jgi:hypothetical protein
LTIDVEFRCCYTDINANVCKQDFEMTKANGDPAPARPAARGALWAAGILFLVFAVNIVVGKIAVLGGATVVPGLGDVGEFLVLFAAVVLFMIGCLAREKAADSNQQRQSVD